MPPEAKKKSPFSSHQIYACDKCPKKFKIQMDLVIHIESKHRGYNMQSPKMVKLNYSKSGVVEIQEGDYELDDSDDELVKEIVPTSHEARDLSKPKRIHHKSKLHTEVTKPGKRSKTEKDKKNALKKAVDA